jgi:hypothetical protein
LRDYESVALHTTSHIYHIIIYIITWDHSHVTRNGFSSDLPCCDKLSVKGSKGEIWLYPPQRSCRGIYWFHHVRPSVRPSVDKILSYDNLSCVSQNLLKFYQLFTGEERRIPFIFDDFHLCRSRVIGLDMTENRIFTLCRMITWVVFLRIFWNFISSLPVKRVGSLSFLTVFTFAIPELLCLPFERRETYCFSLIFSSSASSSSASSQRSFSGS